MTDDNDALVAHRRAALQTWINDFYGGAQVAFRAATGINQGELSGLLKDKSFGEKKARKLEYQAKMPRNYLDGGTQKMVDSQDPETELQELRSRVDHLSLALSAMLKISAEHRPLEFQKVVAEMQGQLPDMPASDPLRDALTHLGKAKDGSAAKPSASVRAKNRKR